MKRRGQCFRFFFCPIPTSKQYHRNIVPVTWRWLNCEPIFKQTKQMAELFPLIDGKLAQVVLTPKSEDGVVREIDGLITWLVSGDAELVTISEDSRSAIYKQGALGVVSTVSATADADLDADEVREILFSVDLIWSEKPVEASVLEGTVTAIDAV